MRSIRCPVPAPPCAVDMGLPAGLGRGGDSSRHPVPPHADEYSGQLNDRADTVPHTRPAEVRPDMPGTGVEQSTEKEVNRWVDTSSPRLPSACGRAAS
jgi:hypothetical protein